MNKASQAGCCSIDKISNVGDTADIRVGLFVVGTEGDGHVCQGRAIGQEGSGWMRCQPCPCAILAILPNLTSAVSLRQCQSLTKDTFPVNELLIITKSRAVAIACTVKWVRSEKCGGTYHSKCKGAREDVVFDYSAGGLIILESPAGQSIRFEIRKIPTDWLNHTSGPIACSVSRETERPWHSRYRS